MRAWKKSDTICIYQEFNGDFENKFVFGIAPRDHAKIAAF